MTLGFCPILFSAFRFKLHRFVDYNRNSCSLRRYERIHGRMHIVQKVPRAFSNWQAAFSGSQGTLVLSVPQEHHVYNLQNIRLFLSKWSVCGQQKKSKMDDLLLIFKKQYEKIIQNFCHHSVVLISYKICMTSLFIPFTVFVHTTVVNGVQNYITIKN